MKRRGFIKNALTVAGSVSMMPMHLAWSSRKDHLSRIGLTTVVFRNRFPSTVPRGTEITNRLTLPEVPGFFADRFGIHNVELWTRHFESKETAYVNEIKKQIKAHRSKVIDIQVNTKKDLSDPDEGNRRDAIAEMKEWVNVGAMLGTEFIRLSPMKKSFSKAVESVREITAYAKIKGVQTLVENHGDLFSDPDIHLQIRTEITDEHLGLLADFGNYPSETDRYTALGSIAPYTRLISAKAVDFNAAMDHTSYDFNKCIKIFEQSGYQGVYSLEQWSKPNPDYDYEKITDWMIDQVSNALR